MPFSLQGLNAGIQDATMSPLFQVGAAMQQPVPFGQAINQGVQNAAQMQHQQFQRESELRKFAMEQQRAAVIGAALRGDPSAIQQLAEVDPEMALKVEEKLRLERGQAFNQQVDLAKLGNEEERLGLEKGRFGLERGRYGMDAEKHQFDVAKVAAETRKLMGELARGGTAEDPEVQQRAEKLRKEFINGTKVFRETQDAYGRIKATAGSASPAGDISLIFSFMKMNDPGSTVREGEYATAQNAAGVPDRVRNTYNNLMKGERLAPSQRADFLKQAENLYSSTEKQYKGYQNQYEKLANLSNVPKELVLVDFQDGGPAQPQDGAGGTPDPLGIR